MPAMPTVPPRDETRLRAETLPVVAEMVAERLRGATVLGLTFEPADSDECIRGYVAWERADQCGAHAFTVYLRAFFDGYELAKAGHMPPVLHGGVYDLSRRLALEVLRDRTGLSYARDEQRRAFARSSPGSKLRAQRAPAKIDRANLASELEAAGWPNVADDVREGIPAETILERLVATGEAESDAVGIIAQALAAPDPNAETS